MRGFKIALGKLGTTIWSAMKRVTDLEAKRAAMPKRVPVQEVVTGKVVKLAPERKHLTNLLKMVAYQAESDLVRLVAPRFRRAEDEGRTLIQSALASAADLKVTDRELILGTLANAGETTADLTAALVTGDATGSILHGTEVSLYSDILFLDFFLMYINQAAINNYENRGINNTTEDDYTVLEMDFAKETSLEFNLTFYERRLNLYYAYSDGEYQVDAIKDNLGNLITTLGEPYAISETSDRYGISFDLTDD